MPGDIGFGILLAWLVAWLCDEPLTWQVVLVGIAGALFPDLGAIMGGFMRWARRRRVTDAKSHEDRYGNLHWPVTLALWLIVLAGMYAFLCIATEMTISTSAVIVFVVGAIFGLFHDLFFYGWGVQVLWPWSENLLTYRQIGQTRRRWHWLTLEEVQNLSKPISEGGEGDPDWAKNIYWLFWKYPVTSDYFLAASIEYSLLIAGIVVAIL